jgi:lysine-N-methylase
MTLDASSLPARPRLADHAALRRNLVAGEERLTVQDLRTGEVWELDSPVVEIALCADGTRDLGGVLLAAARRGVFRRVSEVVAALEALRSRGLLTDGIEADPPRGEGIAARPLDVLEGFQLTCDGSGSCCTSFDSVVFSADEAHRARCLVPGALGEGDGGRLCFLPVQGSVPLHALAVTMMDGRCPYLAAGGLCRLHAAGGPDAKPRGCRIFPATFVDDGVAVRVAVAVECPCVLASVGSTGPGAPLVPPGARVAADLLPGSPVALLPDLIAIDAERAAPREAVIAWSRALASVAATLGDPLAAFWTLAATIGSEGLAAISPEGAQAALAASAAPAAAELGLPLMQLASSIQGAAETFGAWRAPGDVTRALVAWLVGAARSLLDADLVEELLAGPDAGLDHERFYFRTTLFGHHLVRVDAPLDQALRSRAVRLLLARALGRRGPGDCASHPAARAPLAAVEMLLHAMGVEA